MQNKNSEKIVLQAKEIDKMVDNANILALTINVINTNLETDIKKLCERIHSILKKENNKGIEKLLKEFFISLALFLGNRRIEYACGARLSEEENNETLEDLLRQLNNLIGLKSVKEKVNDLISFQKVQKEREEKGLNNSKSTMHMAFTGNPGTGKTTVARIVGKMYKKIGLLSTGHFVEASRTDLIAGYQGQTAQKVKDLIEKAKGGVLFIDEAYSITENSNSDSYGRECVTELTKALEDYRDDLVVIVAGYTDPMNKFFESNPGLKSRFNTYIDFEDYNVNELMSILCLMCRENQYELSDGAYDKIREYIEKIVDKKDDTFANGRFMRNIFEDLKMKHAKRVVNIKEANKEVLSIIKPEDFIINNG